MLLFFIAGSVALFATYAHAGYVYMLLTLYLVQHLGNRKRTELITSIFSSGETRLIRMLENLVLTIPFLPILMINSHHSDALMLTAISLLLGGLNVQIKVGKVIPTPFGNMPFEAIVGTRKTIVFLLIGYILCIIAVMVTNFNLAIFSLLSVFAVTMSFYTEPEDEYFVWVFNRTPKGFLIEKIRHALICVSGLILPIISMLFLFHFEEVGKIVLFILLGYAYLIMIVLAKYASFPDSINLPDSVLIALSLLLLPILIALIPWFYTRAIARVQLLLT